MILLSLVCSSFLVAFQTAEDCMVETPADTVVPEGEEENVCHVN